MNLFELIGLYLNLLNLLEPIKPYMNLVNLMWTYLNLVDLIQNLFYCIDPNVNFYNKHEYIALKIWLRVAIPLYSDKTTKKTIIETIFLRYGH